MHIENDLRDLLIRVDERTLSIESRLNDLASSNNDRVSKIEKTLEDRYVTMDEFRPVRSIVYGLVALILVAVVGALIGLVIIKTGGRF